MQSWSTVFAPAHLASQVAWSFSREASSHSVVRWRNSIIASVRASRNFPRSSHGTPAQSVAEFWPGSIGATAETPRRSSALSHNCGRKNSSATKTCRQTTDGLALLLDDAPCIFVTLVTSQLGSFLAVCETADNGYCFRRAEPLGQPHLLSPARSQAPAWRWDTREFLCFLDTIVRGLLQFEYAPRVVAGVAFPASITTLPSL